MLYPPLLDGRKAGRLVVLDDYAVFNSVFDRIAFVFDAEGEETNTLL